MGRTVNVAARVQDLTRQHDVDILLTADTCSGLDPRFRLHELPPARLKGIEKPLVVHALEAFGEAGLSPAAASDRLRSP